MRVNIVYRQQLSVRIILQWGDGRVLGLGHVRHQLQVWIEPTTPSTYGGTLVLSKEGQIEVGHVGRLGEPTLRMDIRSSLRRILVSVGQFARLEAEGMQVKTAMFGRLGWLYRRPDGIRRVIDGQYAWSPDRENGR